MKTVIRTGDRVKLYGYRKNRYSRKRVRCFIGHGELLSKFDPAAHVGTPFEGWTEEALRNHFAVHVGLINATGATVAGDLTEKNNPVKLTDGNRKGEVIWADAANIAAVLKPDTSEDRSGIPTGWGERPMGAG